MGNFLSQNYIMQPRFDFTFSYWLFACFLLFEFKITKFNPKIWLCLGVIENIVVLFFMIYYKHALLYMFLFVVINFFIKVLPIWILINTPTRQEDVISGIILFGIYVCWLYINLGSFEKIKQKKDLYIDRIKKGEPATPLIQYITKETQLHR